MSPMCNSKGLLAAALVGLAFVAPQANADGQKGPDRTGPVTVCVLKPPGVDRDGGRRRVEAWEHYRAVCWTCSHRPVAWIGPVRDGRHGIYRDAHLRPWYGPVRDSRTDAREDARRHGREYPGHAANVEAVVVKETPRHSEPRHPGPCYPKHPIHIPDKGKDRNPRWTIVDRTAPHGIGR